MQTDRNVQGSSSSVQERGTFWLGGKSFKTIFLPLLSQCSLASCLQVLKIFSQVFGKNRKEENMPASEEGQPHYYLID